MHSNMCVLCADVFLLYLKRFCVWRKKPRIREEKQTNLKPNGRGSVLLFENRALLWANLAVLYVNRFLLCVIMPLLHVNRSVSCVDMFRLCLKISSLCMDEKSKKKISPTWEPTRTKSLSHAYTKETYAHRKETNSHAKELYSHNPPH